MDLRYETPTKEKQMSRFTEVEIRKEIKGIKKGELTRNESKIYQAWCNLADNWMANPLGDEYHYNGFKGFARRTTTEIVEDFRLNGLIRGKNEPENVPGDTERYTRDDYVLELTSGGCLELDVETAEIRYIDEHGNTGGVYVPGEESYDEYRASFEAPTLEDLRIALQEAQDNFSAETGAAVEEILNTLPKDVDLVPLEEEFEWVFKQVNG